MSPFFSDFIHTESDTDTPATNDKSCDRSTKYSMIFILICNDSVINFNCLYSMGSIEIHFRDIFFLMLKTRRDKIVWDLVRAFRRGWCRWLAVSDSRAAMAASRRKSSSFLLWASEAYYQLNKYYCLYFKYYVLVFFSVSKLIPPCQEQAGLWFIFNVRFLLIVLKIRCQQPLPSADFAGAFSSTAAVGNWFFDLFPKAQVLLYMVRDLNLADVLRFSHLN